jgi:hypothetical protein
MKTCTACKHRGEPGDIVVHHILPQDVAEQAGLDVGTVNLCTNCRIELYAWLSRKVSSQAYDASTKRFRNRSPEELAREYQATYRAFTQYKKRQRTPF